jgi:4-hydroxybenzoate polyprenyltransferase
MARLPAPTAKMRRVAALLHPGPSLLVTACFVAAAWAARHQPPDPLTAARLAGVMLPQQFAIGALNDLCDRDLDRVVKPGKPLVSGAVVPAVAVAVTGLGFALALGLAATFPLPTLPLAAGCAAAGAAYDLGLSRGPLSWAPYVWGFACLPVCAWAAVSHLEGRSAVAEIPLALLLALALHLGNSAPDVEADRTAGSSGLAVRLGGAWSRRLSLALAVGAAVEATAAAGLARQPWPVVGAGSLPLVGLVVFLWLRPAARPFPVLAPGAAVLAAVWLAALP